MSANPVLIEQREDIYILTIHRPDALNALNKSVFDALNDFFSRHEEDSSIRGVVITGHGEKAFVAGADIKEFKGLHAEAGSALSKRGQDVFFKIEKFHAPVVAAVNGFALGGGCELAMACHLRIAGEKARFGQPEVNLGLVPGYGGSQRLIQYIGKTRAMYMLLTGEMITAKQALDFGLVNEVVDAGQELSAALTLLDKIKTKGPIAIKKCITLVNDYFDKNVNGFTKEFSYFGYTIDTEDAREGASAFVEKRKAEFKGM